ncbi:MULTISPECIES: DUF262 domain-containing protein [unclassified Candidatus Nanosynbacter]|uniref:DUF262 domain-containing protein n=1 Tax=unclassified Candidatus Nanosynbacter TaxID=2725944 RepID=UPI001FB57D1C|nr:MULTISPECIES: DUF262 domain-containing protein [unclassified Candidatus Nanosynbacter]MCJ1963224.1 DUF262 domain-containing HNH endonuclease family protein [Candidatus Nanosynbacter sp. TM7-033]UOG67712.1 DUF262 domain-containing HNH endonuclease family protein [Candidatus Nanosynbacter sp. HMT-352]
MSKLNVDQKSIYALLSDRKADYIIPDYQRPYAWDEDSCQTLWDDIFSFAIPDNDATKFDSNDEYFLGSIVTFENDKKQQEVIDGQQRLTTFMLLLRAFYDRFTKMQDQGSKDFSERIASCIWKTDEMGKPDKDHLKIDSVVATDKDKEEFLSILRTGIVTDNQTSRYANNFRFFLKKVDEFINSFPTFAKNLPARILNNCILMPIEAESQDTALRIFSTLNDRGLPLSDSDIFKAQFYQYYKQKSEDDRDEFIKDWKKLEETCEKIFHPITGTPMDDLFTRYMYFIRAKRDNNKSSTTESLRRFYERDKYSVLKQDDTFENLKDLAQFWEDITDQNRERFSEEVLKKLFILNYAPNSMWNYFISVYYLANRTEDGKLDDEDFKMFLDRTIAFIWGYAIMHPGVNALRTPIFAEMLNIVNLNEVTFSDFKFDKEQTRSAILIYDFKNGRPITKSMLALRMMLNKEQSYPKLSQQFDIEHIYPRKRQENEKGLSNNRQIDLLGNKSLLEKRVNIRASDYRFEDKIKYYQGFDNSRGQRIGGTENLELKNISNVYKKFGEKEIVERTNLFIDDFMNLLDKNGLIA